MPSHKHLHARAAHRHWSDFVERVANDLNPFNNEHAAQKRSPETVYKTVYQTMSADGPVAGWTTIGVPGDPTDKADPTNKAEPTKNSDSEGKVTAAARETEVPRPGTQKSERLSESIPESLANTKSIDVDDETSLALAGTGSTTRKQATELPTQTFASTDATSFSLSPSATDDAASSSSTPTSIPSSSGASPATTAGIVIGVLGGLLVVALIIFFFFNKRRKQQEQQQNAQDDEKVNGAFVGGRPVSVVSVHSMHSDNVDAPQLSLRPVTQFNPTFSERRSSKGAGLMLATAGASSPREKGGGMWERPSTGNSTNPENPFSDNARSHSPTANGPSASPEPVTNPFDNPEHIVGMAQTTDLPPATPTGSAIAGGSVAVMAAAAVAIGTSTSLTRKQSTRKEAPAPLDLTMSAGPPSPTGTDFSEHSVAPGQSPGPSKSAAAIAEAGGPPATAVHRVQLDFKSSMEDELDLHAGQLVRILHEYDDGWALCIRLDRSKQGVVPRTCLSTRPVKPRPAGGPPGSRNGGPPVNPNGPRGTPRGPGPNYAQAHPESPMRLANGRPQSPGQMRPYSPAGGRPQSPAQMRPYSPAGGRPQSPAQSRPYSPAGGRPQSPAQMRPYSPAGGPRMNPGPRAQSPGPRQQRPQSPNGMSRRPNQPGPSPMNPNNAPQQTQAPSGPLPQPGVDRKPVPGQAY